LTACSNCSAGAERSKGRKGEEKKPCPRPWKRAFRVRKARPRSSSGFCPAQSGAAPCLPRGTLQRVLAYSRQTPRRSNRSCAKRSKEICAFCLSSFLMAKNRIRLIARPSKIAPVKAKRCRFGLPTGLIGSIQYQRGASAAFVGKQTSFQLIGIFV